jgi:hypothetical protein
MQHWTVQVEREINTFIEAAAEAARQKQVHSLHKTKFTLAIMLDSVKHLFFVNVLDAQAAARAAEFEAAALAWLTEPSAPPSQSRLKGRKAHAGRASQVSPELKL